MPDKLRSGLVTTACYTLFLKFAAAVLPDPRGLRAVGSGWSYASGFHVSWLGALLVGAIMAVLLSEVRTWLVRKLAGTGFHWPTLASGFLATLLVLIVANGFLWRNAFTIRGVVGWAATPVLVWLCTFAYERAEHRLFDFMQHAIQQARCLLSRFHQRLIQNPEAD